MELLNKPPPWLIDNAPEGLQTFLTSGGWPVVLGVAALVVLLLVFAILRRIVAALFRGRGDSGDREPEYEDLESIPPPAPSTGDRRLTIDGVPVRLRLIVIAPAGRSQEIQRGMVPSLLDHVVVGLGDFVTQDQPRIRIWPAQLSYEGFANAFHNRTPIPEGENVPSRWVVIAGRALVGAQQVLIGMALQSVKPNTLGRKRLEAHEWPTTLRIRVRE